MPGPGKPRRQPPLWADWMPDDEDHESQVVEPAPRWRGHAMIWRCIRRALARFDEHPLFWSQPLAVAAVTIGAGVLVWGLVPDWAFYRAGGYNPIVKLSQ